MHLLPTGTVRALEPDRPVVGTVPAIKPAAAAGEPFAGWATEGTTASAYQADLVALFAAPGQATPVACPGLADAIEAADPDAIATAVAAAARHTPDDVAGVVLGCTHYPLLTGVISYVVGDTVTLVSSAEETAKDVYRVLADADQLRDNRLPEPEHRFTTTGDPAEFARLARRFLGPEVADVGGRTVRAS